MSIWFFIVAAIGIAYAVNRLTSTTDLPVSEILARARRGFEEPPSRTTGEAPEREAATLRS